MRDSLTFSYVSMVLQKNWIAVYIFFYAKLINCFLKLLQRGKVQELLKVYFWNYFSTCYPSTTRDIKLFWNLEKTKLVLPWKWFQLVTFSLRPFKQDGELVNHHSVAAKSIKISNNTWHQRKVKSGVIRWTRFYFSITSWKQTLLPWDSRVNLLTLWKQDNERN